MQERRCDWILDTSKGNSTEFTEGLDEKYEEKKEPGGIPRFYFEQVEFVPFLVSSFQVSTFIFLTQRAL